MNKENKISFKQFEEELTYRFENVLQFAPLNPIIIKQIIESDKVKNIIRDLYLKFLNSEYYNSTNLLDPLHEFIENEGIFNNPNQVIY